MMCTLTANQMEINVNSYYQYEICTYFIAENVDVYVFNFSQWPS